MDANLRCTRPDCGRTYYSASPKVIARDETCECGGALEVVAEPVAAFMREVSSRGRANGRRRPSSRAAR